MLCLTAMYMYKARTYIRLRYTLQYKIILCLICYRNKFVVHIIYVRMCDTDISKDKTYLYIYAFELAHHLFKSNVSPSTNFVDLFITTSNPSYSIVGINWLYDMGVGF